MAVGDKSIGKLTLDISDVEAKVKRIDVLLKSIGAGKSVSLSAKVANEVKKQLTALEKVIKDSVSKIQSATQKATTSLTGAGSLQSSIQKVTEETTTMGRSVTGTGATVEKVLGQMRAGYDALGKKVREFTDENGNITKKVYDETSAFKDAMKIVSEYYTKMAQLHSLDVSGKKDTPQYTKLLSEIDALNEKWKNIDLSIRGAALRTNEAARAAKLYSDTIKAIDAGKSTKDQETALRNLVTLYQEYYKYYSMSNTFAQKGDIENAEMYQRLALGIKGYIDAIVRLNPALDTQAQAEKRVVEAHLAMETAVNKNIYAEQTENIKAYADALTTMLNEQAKFNQQVASGKLVEGTEQYKAAEERLKHLEQTAIEAGQKLDQAGRDAAMGMNHVKDAIDKVNVSMGAINDSKNVDYLAKIKQVYFELTDAIKRYNAEQKVNNTTGMAAEQAKIDALMKQASMINSIVTSSNIEASVKQQILNVIQQCTTAETQHNAAVNQTVKSSSELESQMTGLLTRMFSIMAVIRTINNLISNTVEYVSQYYDKMNEIQIITQKSNEEVAQLGETYRDIAEQMNVSSLDMADAAIYFTRQGLSAAEIEKRLKNVTMYAKTANVEFTEAAEIITSVVNSMGLVEQEAEDGRNAAQRVADVFLLVGDNAATSGQEIGSAMQKAAAAAGTFGLSMEWLASYIATVSETTRQEARTIGTALNTIIARLHSIRTTGYNADDDTKINDIAKALHTVDIELMDQEGNWRDMEDIFQDVAGVWDTLNGKQKSYIATTMAGVKQQNVFLALMKDMAKGAENGSRAYELYNLAINSAGTAQEKYATWTDSVKAAQERLNVAQEKFYSLLDANVIKSWYDMLSGIVSVITSGTESLGGLNLIIPVTIGLITTLIITLKSLKASAEAAGAASIGSFMVESHPIMLIITAVGALITVMTTLGNVLFASRKKFEEASEAVSKLKSEIDDVLTQKNKLSDMANDLGGKINLTKEDLEKYSGLLEQISKVSPDAAKVVQQLKNGFVDQKTAVKKLNEEIDKYIANTQNMAAIEMLKKYNNYQSDTSDLQRYYEWDEAWFGGMTGKEGFARALEQAYNNTYMWDDLVVDAFGKDGRWLTHDTYKQIQGWLEDGIDWNSIATYMWGKMFAGDTSYDVETATANEVTGMIDDVMSVVGQRMSSVDSAATKTKLFSLLFDSNGNLRVSDVNEASKVITNFVSEAMDKAFDATELLTPSERLVGFVRDLFGEISSSMYTELRDLASDNPDIVGAISEMYDQLLGSGLSKTEIKELLKDTPINEWADAYTDLIEMKAYEIQSRIQSLYEAPDFGIWDMFGDRLGKDVDYETLGLIENLAEAEVDLEKLKQVAQDSASIDQFKEALRGLSEEMGVELPEATEEAEKTLADYVKDIKDAKSEVANLDKLFKKGTENGTLTFEDIIGSGLADAHPELLLLINDYGALIARIKELKELKVNGVAEAVAGVMWNSTEEAKRSPYAEQIQEAGVDTLKEYRDMLEMAGDDVSDIDEYVNRSAEAIREAAQDTEEAAETWLEAQKKIIRANEELNWAKNNGFIEQIGTVKNAYGGEEYDTDWMESGSAALDRWNKLDEEMRKSIADTYPSLIKSLRAVEDAEQHRAENGDEPLIKASKKLNEELKKIESRNSAKYFKSTYDAIDKLEKGTISATNAYQVFNDELDKVTKANEDINDVYQKMADGTEIAENDVSNLASVLGMSADQILQDFPGAVELFNELIGESGDLRAAFDALNEAAFIRITGTSDVDFSALQNGLISTQNLAQDVIDLLIKTGQWEVQTIPLDGEAWVKEGDAWVLKELRGMQQILKPTGSNPYKGTKSTGSKGSSSTNKRTGGGGGSSKTTNDNQNKMTEVELALNRMEQVHAIQEYQQSYYQAQSANFEQNGYLQGVIDASRKEIGVLEEQNVTLAENLRIIEAYISAKKQELAGMDESDEKYAEAADDLDKLQKTHQNYSKELIENKTAIDQLNESIDEQNKKIRDMEIDIRKTIYKAIEDREKKKKNMLQNEITMENLILDIIKKRYETERDRILANADARIEALQQERDLLSEQLQIRKEMAEKENKAAKLAQLEANYQRIIADPTRMKEAQKIQKDIADLREEMAWDSAEEEVKAQQESLDQQITSLTDYKQYIEDFYEDLFEHPQKLIEEMESVLSGTDEQIIEWLKQNSTEFATSTANTQEQMVQGWQETLDGMRGILRTYWEEVEAIIAGGDENILNFLMANDEDFAKAGKLEAEKYVDEWKKKLSDLHKAVEDAITIQAPTYTVVNTDTTTSSSSSGSGSGGGGSSKKTTQTATTNTPPYYLYGIKPGKTLPEKTSANYNSFNKAVTAGKKLIKNGWDAVYIASSGGSSNVVYQTDKEIDFGKAFKKGGLATFTGPAWLDGTASDPERVLSPYQTKLFETMVNALERIGTIAVPSMPRFGGMQTGNSNAVSVGDIIVNVDNLNTDDDYEDLANKVGAVLMERIGKTAVIGGLRING